MDDHTEAIDPRNELVIKRLIEVCGQKNKYKGTSARRYIRCMKGGEGSIRNEMLSKVQKSLAVKELEICSPVKYMELKDPPRGKRVRDNGQKADGKSKNGGDKDEEIAPHSDNHYLLQVWLVLIIMVVANMIALAMRFISEGSDFVDPFPETITVSQLILNGFTLTDGLLVGHPMSEETSTMLDITGLEYGDFHVGTNNMTSTFKSIKTGKHNVSFGRILFAPNGIVTKGVYEGDYDDSLSVLTFEAPVENVRALDTSIANSVTIGGQSYTQSSAKLLSEYAGGKSVDDVTFVLADNRLSVTSRTLLTNVTTFDCAKSLDSPVFVAVTPGNLVFGACLDSQCDDVRIKMFANNRFEIGGITLSSYENLPVIVIKLVSGGDVTLRCNHRTCADLLLN